jgi:uncharacterized protein
MQPEGTPAVDLMLSTPQEANVVAPPASANGVCLEPASYLSEPAPLPAPSARPVQPQERVAAVDVLRGVALMGILAMNIVDFGWPGSAYDNPRAGGNTSTVDLVVWQFNHVVFDEKMMTIFSMLFGAGLVLMAERSEARGASLAGVYYRRVTWLLLIGLAHAYLLWHGDILVLYAECGFLLYLFRRRRPRTLIALGAACLMLPILLGIVISLLMQMSQEQYWGIQGPARDALSKVGEVLNHKINPGPEVVAEKFSKAIEVHRGGYFGILRGRALELVGEQTIAFVFVTLWMVGGRMLVGMGLMKLDVFSARRSRRFYLWMVALGYGFGLPVVAYDSWLRITNDFRGPPVVLAGFLYGYLSAIAIALGHVGVVMLIYRSGAITWLTSRLAAAGRMALSNYLMQTVICTTLFYGYGYGLFGYIPRLGLAAIVVAIWTFQLSTSIIWLRFFRFGPAEWLWRSLTYWKLQPMLVRVPVAVPLAPSTAMSTELPAADTHFHIGD